MVLIFNNQASLIVFMKIQKPTKPFITGNLKGLLFLVLAIIFLTAAANRKKLYSTHVSIKDTTNWPATFGFGRKATEAEIERIDIDVTPAGHGLPIGSGTVDKGRRIYEIKCASCHGKNGTEGPYSKLVGAMGDTAKAKTIGNYWPYASTVFDYIRRAMPFNMPGSLSNNEVYSLTAFLLYRNKIIDSAIVMHAARLRVVKMPARSLFVNDDRNGGPEVR